MCLDNEKKYVVSASLTKYKNKMYSIFDDISTIL